MLIVVASKYDRIARAIVSHWGRKNAALLTCEDLSSPGWQFNPTSPEQSTAVINGLTKPATSVTGILTRRSAILEQELLQIAPSDREYVAAEMNAFLISWLSSLRCPILNRPTATCLSGPGWRPEQWIYAAAHLGIPVIPISRRVRLSRCESNVAAVENTVDVTVLGDRCFGSASRSIAKQAMRLAKRANVALLGARFSHTRPGRGFRLFSVNPWPDLRDVELSNAAREYLQRESV